MAEDRYRPVPLQFKKSGSVERSEAPVKKGPLKAEQSTGEKDGELGYRLVRIQRSRYHQKLSPKNNSLIDIGISTRPSSISVFGPELLLL